MSEDTAVTLIVFPRPRPSCRVLMNLVTGRAETYRGDRRIRDEAMNLKPSIHKEKP